MTGSLLVVSLRTERRSLFCRAQILLSTLVVAGSILFGDMVFAQTTNQPNISRLISTGQIAEARVALEAQNPSQADRLFFEGRVLKAKGDFPEAIEVFREVLQMDPNYINAKRELAHTLLLNRDYGSAEFHFNALLRIDQNDQMRDGYLNFLNLIDQNKPVGLSGYFSILPSTNVNRGTTNTVFDTNLGKFVIDPSSQPDSGVGVQIGFSGYFRHLTSPTSRISLNWDISGTQYEENHYNSAVGNVALSYEQITPSGRWWLSPYYRHTWRADESDYNAKGLNFGLTHRLNDKNLLGLLVSHEYRNFDVQDFRDGAFSSASLSISHQTSPSLLVSAGIGVERSSPEAVHLQYDAQKIFTSLSKSWEGGLQTSLGLEYGQREFVGVYPLTNSPREDDFYKIGLGAQNSKINFHGFTPALFCSHTINTSNVAFYDYTASECQLSLNRNF